MENKKQVICLVLVLSICSLIKAQSVSDNQQNQEVLLQTAQKHLTGVGKSYNPEKAFELNMECAKLGNAKAMNAIGIQYSKGLGVEVNLLEASKWFERAAMAGYPKAWCNLGDMFRKGLGTPIQYKRAFECYQRAAVLEVPDGRYYMAYMLYKGLGVQQDYVKAYQFFHQNALAGSVSSMYFLGLCFRNGYGVARNTDSARFYLKKAAAKGDKQSKTELSLPDSENPEVPLSLPVLTNTITAKALRQNFSLLNEYRRVRHNVEPNSLSGDFTGYALRYDWSGKYLVGVSSLSLHLEGKDDNLKGDWVEDNALVAKVTATLNDSALLFDGTNYQRLYHYSTNKPELFEFKSAELQLVKVGDSVYLAGNLQLYSPSRKEPAKPVYVLLFQKTSSQNELLSGKKNGISELKAFPNPATTEVNISFTVSQAGKVALSVINMEGKIVYIENAGWLLPGQYLRKLKMNYPTGSYAVKLTDGLNSISTTVIKH